MTDKQTILDLENRFWQAIADKDVAAAQKMMGDKTVFACTQGAASIDGAAFAQMMSEGKWELHEFELSDVVVEFPKPDLALIGYTVGEKLSVDGEPLELTAADTSVWIRNDEGWSCVLHTESLPGDPFGRDRTPA